MSDNKEKVGYIPGKLEVTAAEMPPAKSVEGAKVNDSLSVLRTANARRRSRVEAIERSRFQPFAEDIAAQIATAVTAQIIAALTEAGYIPGKLEVTATEVLPAKSVEGKKTAKKEDENV